MSGNTDGGQHCTPYPSGPVNLYAHYIGPNPPTSFNFQSVSPRVDPSSFVGPFSCVIGDVTIERNVFIAPLVSIRADEGFPFFIGHDSNLQDGVIVHGLKEGRVEVGGRQYSVYIGVGVNCTHGCILHGPCLLGDGAFIGFGAIVLNATVGEGCYISPGAIVTGGVTLAPHRFVPPGVVIDTQNLADALRPASKANGDFSAEVRHVNNEFSPAYTAQFGYTRCSCGMAYDPKSLLKSEAAKLHFVATLQNLEKK
jgi:carbon dioxide concentrating mechanism protein CcmM